MTFGEGRGCADFEAQFQLMSSLRQPTPRGVDPMAAVGAHGGGGGDMLSEFHELAVLGCGAYGRAVKSRWAVTGEVVVVKRVRIDLMEPKEREEAAREVAMMQLLDHPNCIKYRTSFVQDGSLYIVMEHATVRHLPICWVPRSTRGEKDPCFGSPADSPSSPRCVACPMEAAVRHVHH